MRSQWECLLENLGEWQGSFTRFSPQGEPLTPSEVEVLTDTVLRRLRATVLVWQAS